MPRTIEDLPAEIFWAVADELQDRGDVRRLRQVSRTLEVKTKVRFWARHFNTVYVHINFGDMFFSPPLTFLSDNTFAESIKTLGLRMIVHSARDLDHYHRYVADKTSPNTSQLQFEELFAKMRRLEAISTHFEANDLSGEFPDFKKVAKSCFESLLTGLLQALSVQNLEHLTSLQLCSAPATVLTGLSRRSVGFAKITCLSLEDGMLDSEEAQQVQRITTPENTRYTQCLADFLLLTPKLETLDLKKYRIFPEGFGSDHTPHMITALPAIKTLTLRKMSFTSRHLSTILLHLKPSLRKLNFWNMNIIQGSWQDVFHVLSHELPDLQYINVSFLRQGEDLQVDFRPMFEGSLDIFGPSGVVTQRRERPDGHIWLNSGYGDDMQKCLARMEEGHALLPCFKFRGI